MKVGILPAMIRQRSADDVRRREPCHDAPASTLHSGSAAAQLRTPHRLAPLPLPVHPPPRPARRLPAPMSAAPPPAPDVLREPLHPARLPPPLPLLCPPAPQGRRRDGPLWQEGALPPLCAQRRRGRPPL